MMIEYNWAVWKNCRLAGYVRAYSEIEALRKAKEKFGDNLFIERMILGNPIPSDKDYVESYGSLS